jgi:RNA polymerase sigma-70 factor (ECF subfamily)
MNPDNLPEKLGAMQAQAFGWALHCCGGDPALAEDVLQAACVKVIAGQVKFTGGAQLKTWWFGVIRFSALEELRRERGWRARLARLVRTVFPSGAETGDPRPHPALQLELDDESARLRGLLAKLPARQAEVLHLVFYENLTIKEAARVMRVGLGSERTHYERGKRRLRKLLEQEER